MDGLSRTDEQLADVVDAAVRSTLDSLIDPVMIFEPVFDDAGHPVDWRYAEINRAACEYASVRREDLIGRRVLDLYPGERGSAMTAMYIHAFESGEPLILDDVLLPVEAVNAERYADIQVSRVGDRLNYTMRDATARHAATRERARSETMFRLLAENSSDVVLLRDFDDLVTWASPSVRDMLGWNVEDLVGTPALDLVHPDDLPDVVDRRKRFEEKGRVAGDLVRVRRSDGTYRVMALTAERLDEASMGVSGVVIGLRDVDDLVRQRESAEFEAARREAIVGTLLDPHVLMQPVRDASGTIVDFVYLDCNEAACVYNGRPREETIGARLSDVVPAHRDLATIALYVRVMETGEPLVEDDYPFMIDPGTLEQRFFDLRAVRVGELLSLTWRDVTDRHTAAAALVESEARYRLLAENSSDVVLRVRDDHVLWVSPSLTRTLGWHPDEWIGHPAVRFDYPADASVMDAGMKRMQEGEAVIMRVRLPDREGQLHWVEMHSQIFRDAGGESDGFLSTFRVVDEEVRIERELERRAQFDDLTGLLKRDEAIERLDEMGRHKREGDDAFGLLFVDVDEFKSVNDRYGHTIGDVVLRAVSSRIKSAIRGGDFVARLGGDEFLVVIGGVHDSDEARLVAEKVRAAVAEPMETTVGTLRVTVSIGVTLSRSVESGSDMITRADDAMYRAKRHGRNRVVGTAVD